MPQVEEAHLGAAVVSEGEPGAVGRETPAERVTVERQSSPRKRVQGLRIDANEALAGNAEQRCQGTIAAHASRRRVTAPEMPRPTGAVDAAARTPIVSNAASVERKLTFGIRVGMLTGSDSASVTIARA